LMPFQGKQIGIKPKTAKGLLEYMSEMYYQISKQELSTPQIPVDTGNDREVKEKCNMFKRHTLCIQNRRPGPLSQVRDDRLCRRSNLFIGVRCQVSGVSNCRILTPDTRHLNTAGKGTHPYHPSGVNQSRALWTRIFTCALIVIIGIFSGSTSAGEVMQLSGVIHVHSTFSSGKYSIGELVSRAENKGLEVLILTDHDQVVMEYGLFPFRNLIKRREERPSILLTGPENYLAEIERLNKQQQSVLIIPAVESSPFYFWSGNPFGKGLTAHDYHKELLIIGMHSPDDYFGLPLLHGRSSTRYAKDLLARFLIFLAAFLLSIYLMYQKGKIGFGGALIAVLSLAMMVNHHPFKSSRFDAYHGDQGAAPYQDVIDYARSKGGMVFWAHPESNYSKNGVEMGPVKMMTDHYPDALIQSENYTGFSAMYGDTITATKAGMHWDRVLSEYCSGIRAHRVWGIAGTDYHAEENGVDLDTYQTVFLVENRESKDVLKALERGQF